MAYENVPQRLLDGEDVPVSEIVGYAEPQHQTLTKAILSWMNLCGVISLFYADETRMCNITPFGHEVRLDFVVRLEGECPECEECP